MGKSNKIDPRREQRRRKESLRDPELWTKDDSEWNKDRSAFSKDRSRWEKTKKVWN